MNSFEQYFFSYLLTIHHMALMMITHAWVAVWGSLLPLVIVGVEAYDSLGLKLDACKPLEIDPHPPLDVHLDSVDSVQNVLDICLRLEQGSSSLKPPVDFVGREAWYR